MIFYIFSKQFQQEQRVCLADSLTEYNRQAGKFPYVNSNLCFIQSEHPASKTFYVIGIIYDM